jgi:hypothetical protein
MASGSKGGKWKPTSQMTRRKRKRLMGMKHQEKTRYRPPVYVVGWVPRDCKKLEGG